MAKKIVTTTLFAGPPYVGKTTILTKISEMIKDSKLIDDREPIFGRTRFLDRLFLGPLRYDDFEFTHIFYAYGGQDWLSENRRNVLSTIFPDFLIFVCNSQRPESAEDIRLSYKMNGYYWEELLTIETIGKRIFDIPKIFVINKMDLPGPASFRTILRELGIKPSIVVDVDGILEYPPKLHGKKFDVTDDEIMERTLSTEYVPVFKTIAITGKNIDNFLVLLLTFLQYFSIPESNI
ncbi:MAG: hypothetical protein ACP6IS_04175 [Candidatus Asgardarchaeia archaeon]